MNPAVRSFLAEPAVADPPARVWRDWVLLAAIVAVAIPETFLRNDLVWPGLSLLTCLVVGATVLWRRTLPLAMIVVAFGAATALGIAGAIAGTETTPGLDTMAFVLVLPYALTRWASGRHIVVGAAIMIAAWAAAITVDPGTVGDAIGGATVLLLPAAIGGMVRYQATARARQLDDVKHREREQLARELHDTVAHHVSAIVIQAQAGQALASTQPATAVDVLAVIETEASRTLAEMRSIVGALRRDDSAELTPQQGIADIPRLASTAPATITVDVELAGDLTGIEPVVDAAAYRIAQESVTNAVRHATNATRVDIHVITSPDAVRLTVVDDGQANGAPGVGGFGLIGMAERAKLLGGSLDAGRDPAGGWRISAELPRRVTAS
ncbi:MAG TPA: histidine kinase [Ilumatobacteraceae bacterium]|nr:histidine kinase [Ilumatobacteraceae bacterium]